jgi:hypothetical protein
MANKLTRKGALNVTTLFDRVANILKDAGEVLEIDSKVAHDMQMRLDLLSDHVEKVAARNFPIDTKEAAASNGGWDPNQIGEVQPPLKHDADEPYMATFDGKESEELLERVEGDTLEDLGSKFASLGLNLFEE